MSQAEPMHSVEPKGSLLRWKGSLVGPPDTPYQGTPNWKTPNNLAAGGVFELDIQIPPEYPFKPPKVQFLTKVYHPNISKEGYLSLDVLGNLWSPALSIDKVVLSVALLLALPNTESYVCNPEIAEEIRTNKELFNRRAKDWVMLYASK